MIKIAHRGISAQAPENTRAAFNKMLPLGVSWLETDIDISSDNQLILIHDNQVDRTSDSEGEVNHKSFSELQKIDFGGWFGTDFVGEHIVTLDWLIDFINANQLNVNFELKTAVTEDNQQYYLKRVVSALNRVNSGSDMIVSSFNLELLEKYHQLMPQVAIGVLIEGPLPDNILILAQKIDAKYIHPDVTYLTQNQVSYLVENQLAVNVWTVDDDLMAIELEKWGVNAIFTDFPET
ncbi:MULTISPECIES: glycerophosphodiester phosphodiesterase family protein [Leuconostoc]|uniref:glycerophosphodiester phosphodiesterase family protein n=1 Tax=Leuconostoc TaxID=1243 RepID=UPI000D51A1AD|nr:MULTISPECIES: glycerophosphodiester phosphodiesterase family protein [Leuconostoc]KAA8325216.1 glycerophosphoryl diester phosphodiesterase [Leuconostoc carnosum]KAA8367288.1 glycerophosphoryl diester phosphodiesterase [Leuconostoc carnosum]KAA8372461.1 glycerophosphoryl diester phosphodiesterase [Leuconostoc carnosum]KAA8376012.1 glycerophosphoryl diester phosphodiesterase [Leuconostoc carnosum]KAA8377774.1 glycerophosphoryl diester phosphodiesterase [Leuconostoc carnosum]